MTAPPDFPWLIPTHVLMEIEDGLRRSLDEVFPWP